MPGPRRMLLPGRTRWMEFWTGQFVTDHVGRADGNEWSGVEIVKSQNRERKGVWRTLAQKGAFG